MLVIRRAWGLALLAVLACAAASATGFGGCDHWRSPRRARGEDRPSLLVFHAERRAASRLRGPPGSRFSYSRNGYVLFADIVARVSGESFHAFLTRRATTRDPARWDASFGFDLGTHDRVVSVR